MRSLFPSCLRLAVAAVTTAAACLGVSAAPFHKTSESVDYKCLFNHEMLIVIHKEDIDSRHVKSFVDEVAGTDVDAVMCCPTAWRANVFPSEVDPAWKSYKPGQVTERYRDIDYIMKYIANGGDPVKDILEACRAMKKDFFINYRMNDHHHLNEKSFPTHTAFWREHPEYWLGDSDSGPRDSRRYFNYLVPEVRDHYFAIIEELCTNYDVDGVELDFQRSPCYFHSGQIEEGTPVMTAFVKRIRDMLDEIGRARDKSLHLCVRVPPSLVQCKEAGLDVPSWDALGLVDMINVSPFFYHSNELAIEDFRAATKRAKIYGEMNFITETKRTPTPVRRYTTPEMYRASALSLLARGADGVSLFNFCYYRVEGIWEKHNEGADVGYGGAKRVGYREPKIPVARRKALVGVLKGITDVEYLKTTSKDYVVCPNSKAASAAFPAVDEKALTVFVGDDTSKVRFDRSVLRVETRGSCEELQIGAWLNGERLEPFEPGDTELFEPVQRNVALPTREKLKFYAVPLDRIVPGQNRVLLRNLDTEEGSCTFWSMDLALYRAAGNTR